MVASLTGTEVTITGRDIEVPHTIQIIFGDVVVGETLIENLAFLDGNGTIEFDSLSLIPCCLVSL